LVAAAVADRGARGVDARAQHGVGDLMPAPDRFQQLVPADHALAMAHQIFQKIEHLRLDGAQRVRAAQLPALGVENTIVEPVDHGLSPAGGRLIRHQL
jgi:hypothetical protein